MENRQHWLLNWHSTQNLQLGCDIEKKISGSIIWCWRTHDFIRVESNSLKGAIIHSPRNFWEEWWNGLRISEAYLEDWCILIILAFFVITNTKHSCRVLVWSIFYIHPRSLSLPLKKAFFPSKIPLNSKSLLRCPESLSPIVKAIDASTVKPGFK